MCNNYITYGGWSIMCIILATIVLYNPYKKSKYISNDSTQHNIKHIIIDINELNKIKYTQTKISDRSRHYYL